MANVSIGLWIVEFIGMCAVLAVLSCIVITLVYHMTMDEEDDKDDE